MVFPPLGVVLLIRRGFRARAGRRGRSRSQAAGSVDARLLRRLARTAELRQLETSR